MSFDKIIFEYPEGWLDTGTDPLAGQHLQCLNTIKLAANQLDLGFSTRTCRRMADFAPRIAPSNTLLIATHTVGISGNVVRLKESYLPGYYYFDRTGYSGWAEIAYNQDLQNQAANYAADGNAVFLERIRAEKIRSNSSKYPQNTSASNNRLSGKPYIFLALQTIDDFVARLAYIDQIQLATLLAEKACEQSMQLLVKRHPLCTDSYIEHRISKLAGDYSCVSLTDESVNVLIPGAVVVATVNSGVGFEALLMGVPVIAAGRSDYSFVTDQLQSDNDLRRLEFTEARLRSSVVDNFLCYYLKDYCLHCSDIEKAKSLMQRWESEQYSSMHDILNCDCALLDDIQLYMAELEYMRRCNLRNLKNVTYPSDSDAYAPVTGMGALNRIRALVKRITG